MCKSQEIGKDRKVLIAGAGIGGLTAAVALQKLGFSVEVYEAAPVLKPTGAGIVLAPNALEVLRLLGLKENIQSAGHRLTHGMKVTDKNRNPIQELSGYDEKGMFGHSSTTIHRGALQQALLNVVGEDNVYTGKRCQKVEQTDDTVTLTCEDGTRATGHLLLGADGIHSAVRKQLFPNISLRYSGETCWRGISNFASGEKWSGRGFEMWGSSGRFGLMPISDTQVYWFSTQKVGPGGKDKSQEAAKAALVEKFAHYAEPVPMVLEGTPADKILRHDLFDFAPISNWSKGSIGLIGDAAHATTPNMGQGGCQAIEDAWGLYLCLQREQDLAKALKDFQALRFPKASMVVKNSYLFGKLAQMKNPVLCWFRNAMLRMTPTSVILKQLKQLYLVPSQLPAKRI